MYGGVTQDGSISSQLWSLDLTTKEWVLITPSKNRECHHRVCGPVAATGHSSVLVKDKMYVIFGYNPIYGYLNVLQEFSIGKVVMKFDQEIVINEYVSLAGRLQIVDSGLWCQVRGP